jgi:prepilin-type N-terminal cleavage/methylation domain-containing protein
MRKGFTLIELLVVITILAVLAGAALPYVQNYVEEARIAKAKTDLEEISRAIAVYETREGEYTKGDVSDLTGRYLNKAPIDPWGKSYVVDVSAGTVYSSGPDRTSVGAADKLDDISVPYQPPLALVSVKWVDKNQSGAVDTQNVPDQIQLTFSRKLNNATTDFDDSVAAQVNALLNVKVAGVDTAFNTVCSDAAANVSIVGNRTVIFDVIGAGVFTPGQDSVNVIAAHNKIVDNGANFCLSDQSVVIQPQ